MHIDAANVGDILAFALQEAQHVDLPREEISGAIAVAGIAMAGRVYLRKREIAVACATRFSPFYRTLCGKHMTAKRP